MGRRVWTSATAAAAVATLALLGACVPPTPPDGGGTTTTSASTTTSTSTTTTSTTTTTTSTTTTTTSTTTTTTTTVPDGPACTSFDEVPLADGQGVQAYVSPDGRTVAYRAPNEIRVRDLVTGDDRVVFDDVPAGFTLGTHQLASDGDRVAVTAWQSTPRVHRAWIVDLADGTTVELDWSGVDWPQWTFGQGFSGDLSVYVTWRFGTNDYRFVPSDGSPITTRTLPLTSNVRLNDDASVIAGHRDVWLDGSLVSYPLPLESSWDGVVGLSRDGSRAFVTSGADVMVWHLDSGDVEALPGLPAADEVSGSVSDDGRFFVGTAYDGFDGTAFWLDTATGATAPLPLIDGVYSISDDGRVFTSGWPILMVCSE